MKTLEDLIYTLRETFTFAQRPFTMAVYILGEGVTMRRVPNKCLAYEHLNPECRDDWAITDQSMEGVIKVTTIKTSTGEASLDDVLAQALAYPTTN